MESRIKISAFGIQQIWERLIRRGLLFRDDSNDDGRNMVTCAKVPLFRAGTMNTSILRAGLTARQVELCDLLYDGMGISNAEIADRLGIKERTVKTHFHCLFLIFRVASRAQLVIELHRNGYSVPDALT